MTYKKPHGTKYLEELLGCKLRPVFFMETKNVCALTIESDKDIKRAISIAKTLLQHKATKGN